MNLELMQYYIHYFCSLYSELENQCANISSAGWVLILPNIDKLSFGFHGMKEGLYLEINWNNCNH